MALMTKDGLQKLKIEQKNLLQDEKDAVEAVVIARSYGDFSENAELEAANAWLERTRRKMHETEVRIAEANIIDPATIDKSRVNFGAEVTLKDSESQKIMVYKIVGEFESNVQEGKISFQSPLAKSILGKELDDECSFNAPGGEKIFIIEQISYSWLDK